MEKHAGGLVKWIVGFLLALGFASGGVDSARTRIYVIVSVWQSLCFLNSLLNPMYCMRFCDILKEVA